MSNLLTQDRETFENEHKLAAVFIRAAELRAEAFSILQQVCRSSWQELRLEELLAAPACQEQWFIDQAIEMQDETKLQGRVTRWH